ncbi:hypothetical protein OGATHE_005898 [Ogataea polymorpha]|uniref:Uncharacterized protein n=1 Tax=Ogataea polymorpha TaxID=460523 RepID=A0A9P8SYM8_9ASCO|nr:hypothetical protein OGATHE_005898 [Ogataea polymorpha]
MESENGDGPSVKKVKTESPTPQPIPQLNTQHSAQTAKTTKGVDEIVDGSDLRKFLNKHFTEELISGLKILGLLGEQVEEEPRYEPNQLDLPASENGLVSFVDFVCVLDLENNVLCKRVVGPIIDGFGASHNVVESR